MDCFKRCYFTDHRKYGEPQFPHPELEEEYDDDTDNPKWNIEYPLIKLWVEEWEAWNDACEEKYEKESYLRVCPLYRS